jgi:hypothetical protein
MRMVNVLVAITLAASAAAGQTISGSFHCEGKPKEVYSIDVGDHPGHSYVIYSGGPCTWTKPIEIAGIKAKDDTGGNTGASFAEVDGKTVRYHGAGAITMENGDKYYFRNQGSVATNQPDKGTWNFTGGTGKLKGLKGKGTYTCTSKGEPSLETPSDCEIQAEYSLPTK